MNADPWPIGTKVAWFGPYDRQPTGTAAVEKVYKTGHMIVRGRRFRAWSENAAGETGEGYAKASIRKMTPELKDAVSRSKKKAMMRRVGEWLRTADPDTISDDAMASLVAAMKASEVDAE